jgi:hypothetical protein
MMTTASTSLTLQFLAWLRDGERTYGETMEAWRSTCPRLSIWEDAVRDGLVLIESSGTMAAARVKLTSRGRSLLDTDARTGATSLEFRTNLM